MRGSGRDRAARRAAGRRATGGAPWLTLGPFAPSLEGCSHLPQRPSTVRLHGSMQAATRPRTPPQRPSQAQPLDVAESADLRTMRRLACCSSFLALPMRTRCSSRLRRLSSSSTVFLYCCFLQDGGRARRRVGSGRDDRVACRALGRNGKNPGNPGSNSSSAPRRLQLRLTQPGISGRANIWSGFRAGKTLLSVGSLEFQRQTAPHSYHGRRRSEQLTTCLEANLSPSPPPPPSMIAKRVWREPVEEAVVGSPEQLTGGHGEWHFLFTATLPRSCDATGNPREHLGALVAEEIRVCILGDSSRRPSPLFRNFYSHSPPRSCSR